MALEIPDSQIYGSDISKKAIKVADINKKNLRAKNLQLINEDVFFNFSHNPLDIIISNPPYISLSEYLVLMPDVLNYNDLPSEHDLRRKIIKNVPEEFKDSFNKEWPVEVRPIDPVDLMNPQPKIPQNLVWFRAKSSLPENVSLHQCVLAYMSDMSLLDTCTNPHGINFMSPNLQSASLDHAMWFHRPFKADEWLLYSQDSPSASGARGFNRGSIFDTSGNLVASVAQEGLIRVINKETT